MYWFVILQVPCICKWWPSSANISHWYLRTTLQTTRWPAESAPFEYAIPSLSAFHQGGDRVWVGSRHPSFEEKHPWVPRSHLSFGKTTVLMWDFVEQTLLCADTGDNLSGFFLEEKKHNKCIIGIQTGPGTFSWFILFFCICTVMLFNHCSHC